MVNSINTLNFNYLRLKEKTHREGLQTAPEKTFQNSLSTGTRDSCTMVRNSSRHRVPVWAEPIPLRASAQTLAHRRLSDMRHGRAPPPSDSAGHTVLSLPVAAVHPGAGTVTPAEAPAHRPARWRDTLISGRPWPVTYRWTEWDCVLILYYFEAQPPIFDTFQDKIFML